MHARAFHWLSMFALGHQLHLRACPFRCRAPNVSCVLRLFQGRAVTCDQRRLGKSNQVLRTFMRPTAQTTELPSITLPRTFAHKPCTTCHPVLIFWSAHDCSPTILTLLTNFTRCANGDVRNAIHTLQFEGLLSSHSLLSSSASSSSSSSSVKSKARAKKAKAGESARFFTLYI